MIDYAKYENMSKKELLKALKDMDKELQKMRDFVKFLSVNFKNKFTKDFIPYKKSKSYKAAREYEKGLSKAELEAINKELESDINRKYGDEF